MIFLRAIVAVLAVILAVLIGQAIGSGSLSRAGRWLIEDAWGRVTLADLYIGFFVAALVIAWFEPDRRRAFFWILPIPFLGNLWVLLWIMVRLPHLRHRLTRRYNESGMALPPAGHRGGDE